MSTEAPRGIRGHADAAETAHGCTSGSPFCNEYNIAVVCAVALMLAVRTAMLIDFASSNPIASQPDGDAGVYWETAGRIAEGELIGDGPFLSAPLYPYVLAVVRTLGGALASVYVLQLLVHVVTGVMLARLTARKLGQSAGLIALMAFALLQEPAFWSTRLVPSTFQLFIATGMLAAASRFVAKGDTRNAVLADFMTGLLTLVYPPAMVLVPLLFVWVWLSFRRVKRPHSGGGIACGVLASATACLTIAPATVHNWMASGEFIPVTAHAGITFRQGNAPGSEGIYTAIDGISAARRRMHDDTARVFASNIGRKGSYREINSFFFAEGVNYLVSDPLRAAWLIGRKLYWFLTARHYSDIYYASLEQEDGWVNLLYLAPVPTAWLMGPAAAGVIYWRRRGRLHVMDWALLLLPVAMVLAFWYSPRYRLPAVPVLIMLSAGAVAQCLRPFRPRADAPGPPREPSTPDQRRHLGLTGALVALSIATGPVNAVVGFDALRDFRPQYECNRGQIHARAGDYATALEHFIRSDRLLPDQPAVLAAMAECYARLARLAEAERICRRLAKLAPESLSAWLAYGGLYLARSQWTEAQQAFAKCLQLEPRCSEAHWGMWLAFVGSGRPESGVEHLRRVTSLDRGHAAAASEYGIWLATHSPPRGDDPSQPDEEANPRRTRAEYYLLRARRLAPRQPEVHCNLGILLMEAGRLDEAAACFQEALALDPDYAKARRALNSIKGIRPHAATVEE
ncbi:MAG: tetratricopeptide repeat protein [Phycisphaerae bacterium]